MKERITLAHILVTLYIDDL